MKQRFMASIRARCCARGLLIGQAVVGVRRSLSNVGPLIGGLCRRHHDQLVTSAIASMPACPHSSSDNNIEHLSRPFYI